MLKYRKLIISAGILMTIFALGCKASLDSEAAKNDQLMAEAFSDVGSWALCLAQLSCDPKIARSIYVAMDRCVQRTRDMPRVGISPKEYMNMKYKGLLQAVKEMKSVSPLCRKIPFQCNNECSGKNLGAPQEVTDMGEIMTELPPVVECVLSANDTVMKNKMEAIILDTVRRVAVTDPYAETSVAIVEKEIRHVVTSLRKLDEKCENVQTVSNKCI